jgi:hypothetical protein
MTDIHDTINHDTINHDKINHDTTILVSSANLGKAKRERKHNAQILPYGITQSMMKKYVVYYRENVYLRNGKTQLREYFKVESHPRLAKPWATSKSVKMSLHEKLEEANQFVTNLENTTIEMDADTIPESEIMDIDNYMVETYNKKLPKYTSIRFIKRSPPLTTFSLVYDHKDNSNGFRWTCSHTFSISSTSFECFKSIFTDTLISQEVNKLRDKIYEKYAVDLLYYT